MKIGKVELKSPVILAPLAGYGDIAFRRLCRNYGAALTVTEMVSAKGLCYGNEKTQRLLRLAPNESPSCVQLFGSEPECFHRALESGELDKFDIIDINMGCPVPKVTKCGEGSALMKDVARAADIVRACVSASGGRPVTVKHRAGFAETLVNAPEFAAKMQEAGAAAITVHGRTAAQGYGGKADWNIIAETVKAVSVPVIGNGDIATTEDVRFAVRECGCSGVAIGRGALGNPGIFSAFCDNPKETEPLYRVIEKHLDYALEYFDEDTAVKTMRKHIVKYLSGVQGVKELKAEIYNITKADELKAELKRALAGVYKK